ncbi:hypothetical protein FN846DRAFT_902284 [Sphaerosporella brunnea]|uniref:Uncharacterized protein n=1 Tax=Sphaerosporella brunnea TaxID=1250544 RepID=A0A5J5FAA9_9PEZI|nr:hypothetical protein FN846DRAFT_902284 [Sphaerosporella brunnea]
MSWTEIQVPTGPEKSATSQAPAKTIVSADNEQPFLKGSHGRKFLGSDQSDPCSSTMIHDAKNSKSRNESVSAPKPQTPVDSDANGSRVRVAERGMMNACGADRDVTMPEGIQTPRREQCPHLYPCFGHMDYAIRDEKYRFARIRLQGALEDWHELHDWWKTLMLAKSSLVFQLSKRSTFHSDVDEQLPGGDEHQAEVVEPANNFDDLRAVDVR